MRYAQVVPFDVCNGKECGTSLFVQGCSLHCAGCFNPESWDFDGGKEWNDECKDRFLEIISRHYIKRVSFLGGEPLDSENVETVYELILEVKEKFPDKKIWLYTGYRFDRIINSPLRDMNTTFRKKIVEMCDVVIDGAYVEALKDITLAFRGSTNQRLIDVKKTLEQNEIVIYNK